MQEYFANNSVNKWFMFTTISGKNLNKTLFSTHPKQPFFLLLAISDHCDASSDIVRAGAASMVDSVC